VKKKTLGECPHKNQGNSMRQTHKQLEREGWLRQFVADEAQAKDAAEIYDLLGYEVHLQLPNRSRSKKFNSSSRESQGRYQILYIRPKKSSDGEEE
jgi:hypothetical protein